MVAFYNKIASSVDIGKIVDIFHWDFSKVFDTVSHSILLGNLARLEE